MSRFFVTGLPRSRTAWLANLLTYGGSFCYHDGLRECSSLEDLGRLMDRPGTKQAGVSDAGLVFFWRRVAELYPDARWVVVLRHHSDALQSFLQFFGKHRYRLPGGRVMDRPEFTATEHAFGTHCRSVWELIESFTGERAGQVLQVPFDDLDEEAAVRRVWEFCVPGEAWSRERWALLDALRVQTAPEKVTMNLERWRGLRARATAEPMLRVVR